MRCTSCVESSDSADERYSSRSTFVVTQSTLDPTISPDTKAPFTMSASGDEISLLRASDVSSQCCSDMQRELAH